MKRGPCRKSATNLPKGNRGVHNHPEKQSSMGAQIPTITSSNCLGGGVQLEGTSDQIWNDFGPNQDLVDFGQTLVEFGKALVDVGRCRAKFGRSRADVCQHLPQHGRKSAQIWTIPRQVGPKSTNKSPQIQPTVGKSSLIRAHIGRHPPNLHGPSSRNAH